MARQYDGRVEERVNERTRIARELHDTLLQSFHGLLLQLQTAYKLLPARPAEAQQMLGAVIDDAFEAVTEGRDAIQGLRTSTAGGDDLGAALKSLGEDLAAQGTEQSSVLLSVNVAGTPQTLRPLVRDEIYRIAGETLRNAIRHAGATRIEVDLCYDDRQLRLRVRDDGKGIDPRFLREEGRAGHYGIQGMRERAKLIGGCLAVWTAPHSGTEVELSIAASRVYATPPAMQRHSLLRKLFPARTPIES
jgi:signal transduction histidine kinase